MLWITYFDTNIVDSRNLSEIYYFHFTGLGKTYESIGDLCTYFRILFPLTTANVNMDILPGMSSIFYMQHQDVNNVESVSTCISPQILLAMFAYSRPI